VLCAVCCVRCAVCCVLCAVYCVLCAVRCVLCVVCCVRRAQVAMGSISLLKELLVKSVTIYTWHPRSSGVLGWTVVASLLGGLAYGGTLLKARLWR
jgi:hypothetical protein